MKYSQIKAILLLLTEYYSLPQDEAKKIERKTVEQLKLLGFYELSDYTTAQLQSRISKIKKNRKETLFQHWIAGSIGNFGSFQTTIFKAYQIADSYNTAKLNAAFPEWFVKPYQL